MSFLPTPTRHHRPLPEWQQKAVQLLNQVGWMLIGVDLPFILPLMCVTTPSNLINLLA